jgi:hypothetical protein
MTSLRWIQGLTSFGKHGKYTITFDAITDRWVIGCEREPESWLTSRKTLVDAMEWCEYKEGKE